MSVSGDVSRVRVAPLEPATPYEITVAAENAVGRGAPSQPLRAHTREEPPQGHPGNVRVSREGLRRWEIYFYWQEMI